MSDERLLDRRLRELRDAMAPDPAFTTAVMGRLAQTRVAPGRPAQVGVLTGGLLTPRRMILVACVIAIAVVWAVVPGDHSGVGDEQWWLGSSAVYAEEISRTLHEESIDGVVARSTTRMIMQDGQPHVSSTVRTCFIQRDRYRYDIYDNDTLREIQWYVPEGNQLVQTSYRVSDGTTSVVRHEPESSGSDPISRLLAVAGRIDEADRRFEPREIEGRECVGFEIDNRKLDPSADAGISRIWFDIETKRPVLLEFEFEEKDQNIDRIILVFDRFEWDGRLPAGTFVPGPVPDSVR